MAFVAYTGAWKVSRELGLATWWLGPISEPQRDILERMRSVTQHLTAMIEDVLAYSGLELGHEVIRPTDFLVVDLINAWLNPRVRA